MADLKQPTIRPAVIIPVYNHGTFIADVIANALALNMPIIVVDDGSTDTTAATLAGIKGITLLTHRENMGKGAAILTGFTAAYNLGCNFALTIDGDGQHNPNDAIALLEIVANDEERCLVVGRRCDMDSNIHAPWTSRFGRKFSNFWVFASGGPWIEDSQSGFRLYPLPEAINLKTQARRYQFEVEILVRAHRRGISIREAPISVVYLEPGKRISHFHPWRDFLRNSATFSRLIISRIFSWNRS